MQKPCRSQRASLHGSFHERRLHHHPFISERFGVYPAFASLPFGGAGPGTRASWVREGKPDIGGIGVDERFLCGFLCLGLEIFKRMITALFAEQSSTIARKPLVTCDKCAVASLISYGKMSTS